MDSICLASASPQDLNYFITSNWASRLGSRTTWKCDKGHCRPRPHALSSGVWAYHLVFLSLNVLIYKMGPARELTAWCWEECEVNPVHTAERRQQQETHTLTKRSGTHV